MYLFPVPVSGWLCFCAQSGTRAPGAAGVIHTDFEKGFICADIYSFDDFKERTCSGRLDVALCELSLPPHVADRCVFLPRWLTVGSEAAVRAAGKLRMEGRKYVVQDGDIIFFKFNVSSAKKK